MFKKILIAAGTALSVVAAAISFQSSANAADVKFGVHTVKHKGNGFRGVKQKRFSQNRSNRKGFVRNGSQEKSFAHKKVKKKSFTHSGVKKKGVVHSGVKHKKVLTKKKGYAHKPAFIKKHHVKKHHVKKHHVKKHHVKKHHGKKHYVLSNREIRFYLRKKGLYNIRFIDRHSKVVKVIADNRRGYLGKYKVNAYNARIIDGHVIRYH